MSSSPSFLDPVVLPLIKGNIILDVACGYGRWGCLLRTNYFEWGLSEPPVVDAFDVFEANVKHAEKMGVYRNVWQNELPCALPGETYNTILASEVLEHLPLSVVPQVLDEFEARAIDRVVVTTPNFECLRGGSDTFLGMNQFDAHLSFIPPEWLKKRGYKILGAGFGNPRTIQSRILGRCLGLLGVRNTSNLYSLSTYAPSLANLTVAYKDCRP